MQVLQWTSRNDGYDAYWIGLTDTENEGTWKWQSGDELSDNLNWGKWKSGEPNNAPKHKDVEEDCAAVGWDGKFVGDIDCDSKRPVFCVKKLKGEFKNCE